MLKAREEIKRRKMSHDCQRSIRREEEEAEEEEEKNSGQNRWWKLVPKATKTFSKCFCTRFPIW